MVQTISMLEALPFPRNLQRVPEYAGGHHEKMDGTGYPRGIFAGDMSVPARIMAIADVFEALTAQDRPYKAAKKLSETMRIMGFMKRDNHLDAELFDLFVSSRRLPRLRKEVPAREASSTTSTKPRCSRSSPKPFALPETRARDAAGLREFLSEYRPKEPTRHSTFASGRPSARKANT